MTLQEKFLTLYREYEGLLRSAGKEPKEVEEAENDLDGGRLRMCRQIRNYLCHVDDSSFIGISDKMLSFLNKRIIMLKEEGDTAKKHLKKPEACMLNDNMKCSDASVLFKKLKRDELVIINDDDTYSLMSVYELLGCRSTQKIGTLKKIKLKSNFCSPLDDYSKIDKDTITLCTDNGMPDGKLMGQIWN